MNARRNSSLKVALLPLVMLIGGCASNEKLDARLAGIEQKLEGLSTQINQLGSAQNATSTRVGQLERNSTATGGDLAKRMDALQAQLNAEAVRANSTASRLDGMQASVNQMAEQVQQGVVAGTAALTKAENAEQRVNALRDAIAAHDKSVAEAVDTSQRAIKIAQDSRKVSGDIWYKTELGDDKVQWGFEQSELSVTGKAEMDALIARVKDQIPYIFIEIVGYSDDQATESYNLRAGWQRADSVRRYLHDVGHIPLHRMSVVSYGSYKPVADDYTREGRSKNRRVTVQVLK